MTKTKTIITTAIAALALATASLAVPGQAFAGGHGHGGHGGGHGHHGHHGHGHFGHGFFGHGHHHHRPHSCRRWRRDLRHRLDRHPSMSKHPVTPADESDLRLRLKKQTKKKTGLLDITQLSKSKPDIQKEVQRIKKEGAGILLIDAVYQEQLTVIGELLEDWADGKSLFSVGSSGIGSALGQFWNERGIIEPVSEWSDPGDAGPILVISGSCSPVTDAQIEYALTNGFDEVILEEKVVLKDDKKAMGSAIWKAQVLLQKGKSVIVHANGTKKKSRKSISPEKLGRALGRIAREIAAQGLYRRLVISGGDTSSYAAREMGILSVEMIAPLVVGAPLCKATAPGSPIDGLEVNLKGGQVGANNYFLVLKEGRL